MMDEEILKLAKETFADIAKTTTRTIMVTPDEIEAFYRAAYNKGEESMRQQLEKSNLYADHLGMSLRDVKRDRDELVAALKNLHRDGVRSYYTIDALAKLGADKTGEVE